MEGEELDLSLEDIEKIFTSIVDSMSEASKKMSVLGKRLREQTSLEAAETAYLALPLDGRPSWFEYVAEHAITKKFATKKSNTLTATQDGHT